VELAVDLDRPARPAALGGPHDGQPFVLGLLRFRLRGAAADQEQDREQTERGRQRARHGRTPLVIVPPAAGCGARSSAAVAAPGRRPAPARYPSRAAETSAKGSTAAGRPTASCSRAASSSP